MPRVVDVIRSHLTVLIIKFDCYLLSGHHLTSGMLISRHYFTVQQELGDSFTAVDHLLLAMYTNKDFFQVLGANGLNKVCHEPGSAFLQCQENNFNFLQFIHHHPTGVFVAAHL